MKNSIKRLTSLFLALLTVSCLHSQELLIPNESEIKDLSINSDGRLHLLFDKKVCEFEGKKITGECFSLNSKSNFIVPISDEYFAIISDAHIHTVKNNSIVSHDSLTDIISVAILHDSSIYIGTAGSGLFQFNLSTGKLKSAGLNNEFINDLMILDGLLYIALDNGLARLNSKSEMEYKDIPSIITHLSQTTNGKIIAFGSANKVIKLNKNLRIEKEKTIETGTFYKVEYSLNSTFILGDNSCIEMDSSLNCKKILDGSYQNILALENNLLLTQQNNLYSLDLTSRQVEMESEVLSLFSENDSCLWVGSINKVEYYCHEVLKQKINLPSSSNYVSSTAIIVKDSLLFIGTMGEGVFVMNKKGELVRHLKSSNQENLNNIIQLHLSDNEIWAVYLNGVYTINLESFALKELKYTYLNDNYLFCAEIVSNDEFYLGTSSSGLIQYKEGNQKSFLSKFAIYSLYKSEDGLIVGTKENGTYLLKDDSIHQLYSEFNPRSVIGLDGMLVLNTENHINLILENNSIPISNGKLKDAQLHSISENNHSIYIGFANGIQVIDKNRLKGLKQIGLHLNQPKLFNEFIPPNQEVFNHDQNSFSFTFHSNSYYQASSVIYHYRLLGLDSSWQTTQQNSINFYNLNPGIYKFEVVSAFSNSTHYDSPESFEFVIDKPFWEKLWFITLLLFGVSAIIILAVKRRERLLVAKGFQEQEKVKFELEQLKNQIDPHFLFNSLNSLIGIIEENPSAAIESTQLLSDLYRNILKYDKLELITLSTELELAKNYFQMHKMRFEDLLKLKLNVDNKNGKLIPLSCQFLIENAIKHNIINEENHLEINIKREDNYLIVSNSYQPKKENQNYSSGLGLQNLKSRYQLLTNQPVIIEKPGKLFIVKLPIIHD